MCRAFNYPAALIISLLFFNCVFVPLKAQTIDVTKKWDKTYGGPVDDFLQAMVATPDGGYLLGGYYLQSGEGGGESVPGMYDYYVLKIDKNGNKEWAKTYGGDNFDYLYVIVNTADSGYLLAGYSLSGRSGDKTEESKGGYDYWIIKIDKNGNKKWDKSYGGTDYDLLYSIIPTPDGGFLLGGSSSSGIGGDKTEKSQGLGDYWIVKIDSNGNKLWDRTFGGSDFDNFKTVINTTDGGFLLGGYTQSGIGGDKSDSVRGFYDYWIVKTDKDGKKAWDKTFGGNNLDELTSMTATPDGYLLGGDSYSGAGGDKTDSLRGFNDYWIIKIDTNGNKTWDKTFGGTGSDYFSSITAASDGGYLLGGTSGSGLGKDKSVESKGEFDYWIIKVDEAGNKVWDNAYGGKNTDNLTNIIKTSDKGYLLGGRSNSGIGGDKSEASLGGYDFWVLKLGSENMKSPTVSITAPADSATYIAPANIEVTADASDTDGTIIKVDFYNDSKLLYSDSTAPFAFSWKTVAAGNYTVSARATDNSGLTTTSAAIHISVVPNKAPTVSIVRPVVNQTFPAPARIRLEGAAEDSDGRIARVEFFDGEMLLHTEYTFPYTYNWTGVGVGNYTITAKATDNWGATTTSAAVNISVHPNIAPAVSITNPANSASFTVADTILLEASAEDSDGNIARVEFYIGDTLLRTEFKLPYSYHWTGLTAGTYTVTAVAIDNYGARTTSAPITITVTEGGASIVTNERSLKGSKVSLDNTIGLQLYPNPTHNILNIYPTGLQQNSPAAISVISSSGVIIKTLQLINSSHTLQLNMSTFPAGWYLVKFISGEKITYKQFLKL